jgi:hypothetical protein
MKRGILWECLIFMTKFTEIPLFLQFPQIAMRNAPQYKHPKSAKLPVFEQLIA